MDLIKNRRRNSYFKLQIYNEAYLQQLSICDKPIFHSKSEIESALIPSSVEVGNKLLGKLINNVL